MATFKPMNNIYNNVKK